MRRQEEYLSSSEAWLRATLYSLADGLITTDIDGRVRQINPVAERLTGWCEAQAVGRPISEVFHVVDVETRCHVDNPLERVVRERTAISPATDPLLVGKDGAERLITYSGAPIRDEQGEIVGAVVIFRDQIAERAHCQELGTKLMESEERDRVLLESKPEAIDCDLHKREVAERRFHQLADNIDEVFFVMDAQYRETLYINPAYEKMWGRSCQSLYEDPRSFLDPVPASDRARLIESIASNQKGDDVGGVEFRVIHRDGQVRWVLAHAVPVRNQHGEVDRLVGIALDITERKRVESALRESEERFRAVFESTTDCILVWDRDYNYLYANEAAIKHVGTTRDKVIGKNIRDGLGHIPEFMRLWMSRVDEAMRTGRVVRVEDASMVGPVYVWSESVVSPLRNGLGEVYAVAVVYRDISERRRADEALRESEMYNRSLVEHLPQRIFLKDRNSTFLSCNANFAGDLGIEPEEIVGKDDYTFYPRELAEAYRSDDQAVMSIGVLRDVEERYRVAEKDKWIHTIKVPYRDEEGNVIGVLGVFEDITRRREAEEDREKLEAQLNQAQKMEAVGRLAGGVAHDFNNMLNVILGYAEMAMKHVDPSQRIHHHLEEIQKAAERSAGITRQLLAFARKQTISPRVLDLNETIPGMLKMLGRLIGEDVDLVWMPFTELWSTRIDPAQIDQILANLAVNARDAISGVGKLTIETRNVVLEESYRADREGFVPGEYVMLAVSDTGCGMDKDVLGKIFEPFFTTKEQGKGTGLGLATVYGIVKQNKGFIDVHSEPGRGTTFKIYLPPTHEVALSQSAAVAKEAPRGTETVMLVEDEGMMLKLGCDILESQGYTVISARTPREALALSEVHATKIDLLVTDVIMPQMNGAELRDRLTALRPDIKTLFMSGYTADIIARHGVLEEGVQFLEKPFSVGKLAARVREVLDS